MVPVNQVILGGDPLLGGSVIGNSIDEQLQMLERYKQNLEAAKQYKQQPVQQPVTRKLIWDDIDAEVTPMSDEQKTRLCQNTDYMDIYNELQSMVQAELLNLVKSKIENTERGKELLTKQLKIVKKLKAKIISDTSKEMELFKKFKEYSKEHPSTSYEDFIKEAI